MAEGSYEVTLMRKSKQYGNRKTIKRGKLEGKSVNVEEKALVRKV